MKKIRLLSLFLLTFILALAGSFLSACGKNKYDDVTLSCDVTTLTLEKGEEKNVTFTIENFSKSMSNKLLYNSYDSSFLSIETNSRDGDTIDATITAKQGGSTTIVAVTEDGYKSCSIDVEIIEYTETLGLSSSVMYLSESTSFIPNANYFVFDKFATDKNLTYYVCDNALNILQVTTSSGELKSAEFKSVSLYAGNLLFVNSDNETFTLAKAESFSLLAVYDHNPELKVSSTVYVFEDLNVSLLGGYDYESLEEFSSIDIITNKESASEFFIELKVDLKSSRLKYDDFYSENDDIVFIGFDEDNPNKKEDNSTYAYFKISPEVSSSAETSIHIGVYFDVLGKINDRSVYVEFEIPVSIKIAPTSLLVNDTIEEEFKTLNLYNYYDYSSSYGWIDLNVTVLKTNSYWEGVYFQFDEQDVEIKYLGNNISSNPNRLYTSVANPFVIRGKRNAQLIDNGIITIHLVSSILEEELTYDIYYNIIDGATSLNYIDNEEEGDKYSYAQSGVHLSLNEDYNEDNLFTYISTNAVFADISFVKTNEEDINVANLYTKGDIYTEINNVYILNIYMTPIAVGTATYTVYLDNGVNIYLIINVVETLNKLSVNLTGENPDIIANSTFNYEDDTTVSSLKVEILNKTDRFSTQTQFNKVANFEIRGEYNKVSYEELAMSDIVRVSEKDGVYSVITRDNGEKLINFTVSGYTVSDSFRISEIEKEAYIHVVSLSYVKDFVIYKDNTYAYNSKLYWGNNIDPKFKTANWRAVSNPSDSYYFYRYGFNENEISNINIEAKSTLLTDLEKYPNYRYKNDYIYWTVIDPDGNMPQITTQVTLNGVDYTVNVTNGIMFYGENTQNLIYSNVYKIRNYGTFSFIKDINENLSFVFLSEVGSSVDLIFNATITQKSWTMRYQINLSIEQYIEVESISLGSSVDEINFNANYLSTELIVYINPNYATNTNLFVQLVASNIKYTELLKYSVKKYNNNEGVYLLTLSCEDYYLNHSTEMINEKQSMATRVYLMPEDWSPDHDFSTSQGFISFVVNFSNGMSIENAYNLETAEDVVRIGENEHTLSAYYKISTTISMNSYQELPTIGVIEENNNIGFSGTIIGLTEQASITDINIDNNNLFTINEVGDEETGELDNNVYAGLFSKINAGARIEYVTFEGNINIDFTHELEYSREVYVGLLTGVNEGALINVGVRLHNSEIKISNKVEANDLRLFAGGLVGKNGGIILQYYPLFKEENLRVVKINSDKSYQALSNSYSISNGNIEDFYKYFISLDSNIYLNFAPKILVYMTGSFNITTEHTVSYVGGIAGYHTGILERITKYSESSEDLILYGYSKYSAFVNINVENKNIDFSTKSAELNPNKVDYLGGVVGYATNYVNPENSSLSSFKINSTIVGGEVRGEYATGGLIGFVEDQTSTSEIIANTSRTFVRGKGYVGALIGEEVYNTSYRVKVRDNKVEATDDGNRYGIDTSLIIKYVSNYDFTSAENNKGDNIFDLYIANNKDISVGNKLTSMLNSNNYANDITLTSYVSRALTIRETGSSLGYISNDIELFYGDYIVLKEEELEDGTKYAKLVESFEYTKGSTSGIALGNTNFKMDLLREDEDDVVNSVYYMFYFEANGYVNGEDTSDKKGAQNDIDRYGLNKITSKNVDFYPFEIKTATGEINNDIIITSLSSNIITIDEYGSINVQRTGIATLKITSILDFRQEQTVYLYVINYNNTSETDSIIYPTNSTDSKKIDSTSKIHVYGSKAITSLFLIPNYDYESNSNSPVDFTVSSDGKLLLKNRFIKLANSNDVEANILVNKDFDPSRIQYTIYQNNGQVILISKDNSVITEDTEDKTDVYTFYTEIRAIINGQTYYYRFNNSMNVDVIYHEGASDIDLNFNSHSIMSDTSFVETIAITSSNKEENLYYQIKDAQGKIIQERMFDSVVDSTLSDYNVATENDLFNIIFSPAKKDGETVVNTYDFIVSINKNSLLYKDRYLKNIYETYSITFFASERTDGVSCSMNIVFNESTINNLAVSNYQSAYDISVADETIVPGQYGLLEINLDPIDTVFDYILIENSDINYTTGSGTSTFSFAYENATIGGVEYVAVEDMGRLTSKGLMLDYDEIIEVYKRINKAYLGTINIRYFMRTAGVENQAKAGFKVTYVYGEEFFEVPIDLTVKLSNYVKVTLDARPENLEGKYDVARGLTYDLTLETYGYTYNQVTFNSDNENFAKIYWKTDTQLVLEITKEPLSYSTNEEGGYIVGINVVGTKVVDGRTYVYIQELQFNIMEYIFNYTYDVSKPDDLIKGMKNGVIDIALGSKHDLKVDIIGSKYIEYDSTNPEIVGYVKSFINALQTNSQYKVYTNLNSNTPSGIPTKGDVNGAINTKNGNVSILGNGVSAISTIYFKITDYTVIPLRTYNYENDYYLFTYQANYKKNMGRYFVVEDSSDNSKKIFTEFRFNVHQQSSEDSPIPITNYDELMDMKDSQYYILLNDIVLQNSFNMEEKEQFKTITAKIAGLDGNGYSIIFSGDYVFDDISNIGLFDTIEEKAVIKNVTIVIKNSVMFSVKSTSFNVGLLAVNNSGNITNCAVVGEGAGVLSVIASDESTSSYAAGLVYSNSGYITHSHVGISIYSTVNIAGFVAINNRKIASSYFMGGALKNETAYYELTSGFVLQNNADAQIITSYVSGIPESSKIYYKTSEKKNFILSTYYSSGFVFTNEGKVTDCYSNIYIYGGSNTSGFVYNNGGLVTRCFSLCELENFSSSSFGFAQSNEVVTNAETIIGTFVDCYYMKDSSSDINTSLSPKEYEGIVVLNANEFDELDKYFSNYTYTESISQNTIWFYSDGSSYSSFSGRVFNTGRLELAAPNVIAISKKKLDDAKEVVDPLTGQVSISYFYVYESDYSLGDVYNPILISNAEQFEKYILQENSKANVNTKNYRIISDINYADYSETSQIYKTIFFGGMEGNGMDIKNIYLYSSESLDSAGLFAQVGSEEYDSGFIFNLNLEYKELSFVNASVVGALAGTIRNARILNVNITSSDEEELTLVTGKNIVGGVVGLALNNYKIQNVTFSVSASANHIITVENNTFTESSTNYSGMSLAGGLIGVASGYGNIKTISVSDKIGVIGDKVGLIVGFVDTSATVKDIDVYMNENMMIRAFGYGGIVIGESKGTVNHINVYGTEKPLDNLFRTIPYIPDAVGGVIGLLSAGNVSDIYTSQGLILSTVVAENGIDIVGGIVGEINQYSTSPIIMSKIILDASLIGFSTVGGIIGSAESSSTLTMSEIVVRDVELSVYGKSYNVAIGGFIGISMGTTIMTIANSYTQASIFVNTFTINNNLKANVGEFIGASANVWGTNVWGTTNVEGSEDTFTGVYNCYSMTTFDILMQDKSVPTSVVKDLKLDNCLILTNSSMFFTNVYLLNYKTTGTGDNQVLGSLMLNPSCRLKSTLSENEDKYYDFNIEYTNIIRNADCILNGEEFFDKENYAFKDNALWKTFDKIEQILPYLAFEENYKF